jgi:hypothetical protein
MKRKRRKNERNKQYGIGIPTMRRKPINSIRPNNIPPPSPSPLLNLLQIILLVVIKVEPLIIIAREGFLKGNLHRTKVDTVVLHCLG